ncbi:MAG: 2,3-bisphosphoglycerate-independent phosphoglycerate mutase [Gammaproteobacteria bacterium]|nr:2,3-bisphosphoglycerate-independent phosphoglycerate mutase [Gammaproteobacteria bacterium]
MSNSYDITDVWEELVHEGGRIIYLILDGLGGLRDHSTGKTALESACTPNLDCISRDSSCGLLEMVGPGITPGSGPGHLALFGYDPMRYRIGRGVLSALGIDFDLQKGDIAARINFASVDNNGLITDRRAGRLATNTNQQLCEKIRDAIHLDSDCEYFLETVAEYRAVLVLRGSKLSDDIYDTDPQTTGVPPNRPQAKSDSATHTAQLLKNFLEQAHAVLADEAKANVLLLRGFQRYTPLPTLQERFALKALCIARYPMYRGLSRLLGMDIAKPPNSNKDTFKLLTERYDEAHDFYFIHIKDTDKSGEDGDFNSKVSIIEEVDALLPQLLALKPEVLVISADHSTPEIMAAHSWHPVPVLIHAANARVDNITHFDEYSCRGGSLGLRPGVHLMGLALAHAGRLSKFGA